jgi:2-iminobutanoate/2-iminopropanoate deaminase
MEKQAIVTGEPERLVATYSPAVLVTGGRLLFISGQVAFDEKGNVVGAGDIVAQARQVFENLRIILAKAGGDFSNIIKTNYYVIDVSQFPKVAALRSEYFRGIYPASTMVEVKGLVHKDLMLEIEAMAVLE